MERFIPRRRVIRTLLMLGASLLHVAVLESVWRFNGLGAYMLIALSLFLMVLPGLMLIGFHRASRETWWRHPTIWLLFWVTVPELSFVTLAIGHWWAWSSALQQKVAAAHISE